MAESDTMMDRLVAALKSELARQDKDWSWMDDKRGHIEISEGVGSVLIDGQGIIRAILTALKDNPPTITPPSLSCCYGHEADDMRAVWRAMIEEAGK